MKPLRTTGKSKEACGGNQQSAGHGKLVSQSVKGSDKDGTARSHLEKKKSAKLNLIDTYRRMKNLMQYEYETNKPKVEAQVQKATKAHESCMSLHYTHTKKRKKHSSPPPHAKRHKDKTTKNKKCMYVCMYVCMSVCLPSCLPACLYVCMYACMHACMHACMYVCTGPTCLESGFSFAILDIGPVMVNRL